VFTTVGCDHKPHRTMSVGAAAALRRLHIDAAGPSYAVALSAWAATSARRHRSARSSCRAKRYRVRSPLLESISASCCMRMPWNLNARAVRIGEDLARVRADVPWIDDLGVRVRQVERKLVVAIGPVTISQLVGSDPIREISC
jgi:hypothetical protein